MPIALPICGGCICGSLRYEIRGQPLIETMCHCTTCQNRTGSAFSMNLLVRRSDFVVTCGQPIRRGLATGSGGTNSHCFCSDCLVRTHTEPVAHPTLVYVRPGTLDKPDEFAPAMQIWTRSALSWALRPDTPAFLKESDDTARELGRAWRAKHLVGDAKH